MPFAYYDKLGRRERDLYDRSARIASVPLPLAEGLRPVVDVLREALARDQRAVVEAASPRLSRGITDMLEIDPVSVNVLAVRPALRTSELHGLYTRDARGHALIRVWMRTARHRRVVAFRTFLRTLLHEVCHHIDYVHFQFFDSLHTEGFFKRESSLFYQLVPREEEAAAGS
jgi:hypothetical protein